jgi:GNAT superfamily N-acetyltransferase
MKYDNLRFATLEDIPVILAMAQKLYVGSPYECFTMDANKTRKMIEKFIVEGQKDFLVLLAHVDNKPVGVLVGYAFEPLFSNDRAAIEALWFLDEAHRSSKIGQQMMDAFEYWAQSQGCKVIQYGMLSSSPPGMERLYERRGLVLAEKIFNGVFA